MEFGPTINNSLLQLAVGASEATVRHACDARDDLAIHVELEQYADGRDAIRVLLQGDDGSGSFSMLLRNFFDRDALWRVARRAWLRRTPEQPAARRRLELGARAGVAATN